MKYSFKDDYSEGCHPEILQKLTEYNFIQTVEGNYGNDRFSQKARELIHQYLDSPSSEIHFVSGGTQANLTVISSILKPWEAVISADSGHIEVHETGAIEATGHKIITAASKNGKITADQIREAIDFHKDEHQVKPRMVYISNATELGTIYTKKELQDLSECCRTNDLFLYMDGARLAMALTSDINDLAPADIARLTDIFYIGGTKNGALLGEAIVINNSKLQSNFRFAVKQKGALLAKGRLLGIQFEALFEDNLFFESGKKANQLAQKFSNEIRFKGYSFLTETESNQVFPIFPKELIARLQQDYSFHIWERFDEQSDVIRLVTSWATEEKVINEFLTLIPEKT